MSHRPWVQCAALRHSAVSDTLRPMNCSPPGSSVHPIFQARILEWVATSSSRGASQPRGQSCIFCIGRRILYKCTTRETLRSSTEFYSPSVIILSDSLQWTHSGFLYHIYSSISFKSLKNSFLWKSSTKSSRLHQDKSFYSLSTAYLNGSQTLPYIVSIKVGRGAGLIYWCLNFTLSVKYTLICFPDK